MVGAEHVLSDRYAFGEYAVRGETAGRATFLRT
jgi:hypothetical protein